MSAQRHQALTPAKNLIAESLIADYRLLSLVGQGQFAQVYCAIHRRTGQLAALKITRHAAEKASQEPFILHELNHPHIIAAQAIIQNPAGYQILMDYCEGGTLRSHLDQVCGALAPLPLDETQALIGDILQGLDHIHQQQVIHGDLKPENILLTYRNPHQSAPTNGVPGGCPSGGFPRLWAKIGDLGSARFAQFPVPSRREIGSPTYAAPERFEGQSSYASDLYSIGVMLYELLLGDRPFHGSPETLRQAHQTQAPPLPSTLAPAARTLLATALHKDPQRRFGSARALLEALANLKTIHRASTARSSTHSPQQEPIGDSFPLAGNVPTITLKSLTDASAAIVKTTKVKTTKVKTTSALNALPIQAFYPLPQGYCAVTQRTVYWLTPQQQLMTALHAPESSWFAISPDGRWLAAFPRPNAQATASSPAKSLKSRGQLWSNWLSHCNLPPQSSQSAVGIPAPPIPPEPSSIPHRSLILSGPLLSALESEVIQILALDSRHLLRLRVSHSQPSCSYLEVFTRRGQFIGHYVASLRLSRLFTTSVPFELYALPAASAIAYHISLKPFQIRQLRLAFPPKQVASFPWGCLIVGQQTALVLDRQGQALVKLDDFPPVSAISAFGNHQLLIAPFCEGKQTQLDTESPSGPVAALQILSLESLDLGLIF